jgi:hypothetical protein
MVNGAGISGNLRGKRGEAKVKGGHERESWRGKVK